MSTFGYPTSPEPETRAAGHPAMSRSQSMPSIDAMGQNLTAYGLE